MLGRRQGDDDLFALPRLVEIVDRAPGHEPFGQVIGDVAHTGEPELAQRLLQFRPDPVECRGFGEQRGENVGTHDVPLP